MQTTQETETVTITPQGVTATGAQAQSITFYLVNGLDGYCQSQQLQNWCWAATAVAVQNYYAAKQGLHLSTQADVCILNKGEIVNEGSNPSIVLNNNLKYSYIDYAQKFTVSSDTLLQFLSSSVNDGAAMILNDGTSNAGGGHSIVVLGYGQDTSVSPAKNYLVYFDPYLGFAFPGSYSANTFNYAPFENFLGHLQDGTDKLYKYMPNTKSAPFTIYMTPLVNAIPKDSSWNYPVWHVINGKCDTQQNIPKDITSGGVTYCAKQENHDCATDAEDLYYYPRMTLDADPLSLKTYYASSINIKRSGHSYSATLNYGVSYADPHDEVVVTGTSYDSNLGTESKDFYLYLIPMSNSLKTS